MDYSLARREYESNRTLYDQLQQRLQEAGIIAGLHSTSIRMIDAADVPEFPGSPRKTFNYGLGFAAGFMTGILLSLVIHVLDTNIKSDRRCRRDRLGLPLLGVIPSVESRTSCRKISLETQHPVPKGAGPRWLNPTFTENFPPPLTARKTTKGYFSYKFQAGRRKNVGVVSHVDHSRTQWCAGSAYRC